MKKIYFLLIIIFLGVAVFVIYYYVFCALKGQGEEVFREYPIESFEDCVAAGNVIMESYPRQCQTAEGEIFTEDIGNELEKIDLIRLDNPRPNQEIESPLLVRGEARGNWFFEASFPIVLTNQNGLAIAQTIAQAKGDWMTENFVRFEAVLEFEKPEAENKGFLILRKDNPSGLPENDDTLEVPIVFK